MATKVAVGKDLRKIYWRNLIEKILSIHICFPLGWEKNHNYSVSMLGLLGTEPRTVLRVNGIVERL